MSLRAQVLEALRETSFPKGRRENVSDPGEETRAFALGTVPYRASGNQGYRLRGPSKYNKRFPTLYRLIRKWVAQCHPDFHYTTIQVNKNLKCRPHVDQYNKGESLLIALGDFTGGELVVEGREHKVRHRWVRFDGRCEHWTKPFEGERYSLVFFNHTRVTSGRP